MEKFEILKNNNDEGKYVLIANSNEVIGYFDAPNIEQLKEDVLQVIIESFDYEEGVDFELKISV